MTNQLGTGTSTFMAREVLDEVLSPLHFTVTVYLLCGRACQSGSGMFSCTVNELCRRVLDC